jgi:hypothetical protein
MSVRAASFTNQKARGSGNSQTLPARPSGQRTVEILGREVSPSGFTTQTLYTTTVPLFPHERHSPRQSHPPTATRPASPIDRKSVV